MGGGEVQLPNRWRLRKLVVRSAMGCAKLVIPETGFVGEEKFVCHLTGGVWRRYVCRECFIVCPGGRGDGRLVKLSPNPVD